MERKRLEFSVGIFLIVGMLCMGYLALKLGHLGFSSTQYEVKAVFPTVAGLKAKAPVTMAGVNIGEVKDIRLKNGQAELTLSISNEVQLEEDVIAGIKTMGIIGDKYISIAPGASDHYIKPGAVIRETQPPLDIEGLISKFVFGSIDSKDKKDSKEKPEIE